MEHRADDERPQYRLDTQLLSDLWIFRAVARSESITGAADLLNVTQSAVSQRVLRLESRLGVQLFLREKSGLTVTEVGLSLSNALNQVSHLLNDALDHIRRPTSRIIVVSCMPSLATEWLVPKLEDFYRLHPGIEVFVRSEMLPATSKRMQADGIDLVITYQIAPPAELQELALIPEWVFPVCSPGYSRSTLQDPHANLVLLHDEMPWGVHISPPTEWDAWRQASGSSWPGRPASTRRFNLAQLAYHAAVFNQGIAIGRAAIVHRMMDKGELVSALPLPAVAGAHYRISSTQFGEVRPWVRLFADWCRDSMLATQKATLSLLDDAVAAG